MSFLYFVPIKKHQIKWCWLQDIGLDYAFEYGQARPSEVRRGPGEGSPEGLILADRSYDFGRQSYQPNEQQWLATSKYDVLPQEHVLVGRYLEETIGPEQLARKKQLPGHMVRLGDGNLWQIPAARQWASETSFSDCIPRRLTLGDFDEWTKGEVLREYKDFWNQACRWWDTWIGKGSMENEDAIKLAAAALKINYRIGSRECDMLQLLTVENVSEVLQAIIDWPTWEEFQKKTSHSQSDTAIIEDGQQDSINNTPQHVLT